MIFLDKNKKPQVLVRVVRPAHTLAHGVAVERMCPVFPPLGEFLPELAISRAVSLPIFTPRDFMLPRNVSSGFKIPPEEPEYLKDFEWVV